MTVTSFLRIGDYELDAARHYDPATHLWAAPAAAGRWRVGLDPLGVESSGDVVALSVAPLGSAVARGAAFGSLEAAKFVGPLLAPLSGTLVAANEAVLAEPSFLNRDPLAAWLVEIEGAGTDEELAELLSGELALRAWFDREVARYRELGALGE